MKTDTATHQDTQAITRLRRLVTHGGRSRAPDFYGIGSEKCGTTWLWQMFRDHPKIGVPQPKELRYFAHRYLGTGLRNFEALEQLMTRPGQMRANRRMLNQLAAELRIAFGGDEAYKAIFGAMQEPCAGDISPQYCMLSNEGIAHMKAVAPEARIIFLMRDPVSRLLSGAKMKAAEADPLLEEAAICERTRNSFQLGMSRYSVILDRFEAAFPGRVFTGFLDDIKTRPLVLLEELCGFLGVSYDVNYFPDLNQVANGGKSFEVSRKLTLEVYAALKEEYRLLARRFPQKAAEWQAKYESL